jgi:hypothetical protein
MWRLSSVCNVLTVMQANGSVVLREKERETDRDSVKLRFRKTSTNGRENWVWLFVIVFRDRMKCETWQDTKF